MREIIAHITRYCHVPITELVTLLIYIVLSLKHKSLSPSLSSDHPQRYSAAFVLNTEMYVTNISLVYKISKF